MILKLRCTWMVYSMKFQHFKHFLALSGPTWKEQVCYRNPPLKWKSLKTSPIPQNSRLVTGIWLCVCLEPGSLLLPHGDSTFRVTSSEVFHVSQHTLIILRWHSAHFCVHAY